MGDPRAAYGRELAQALVDLTKIHESFVQRVTSEGSGVPSLLLLRLTKYGPQRATDLAAAFGADPSTVSRQVASLVRAGFIERQADPEDGRACILVPTEAGRERAARQRARWGGVLAAATDDWTDRERSDFLKLLRRYLTVIADRREDLLTQLVDNR